MDPDACLRRVLDAFRDGDRDAAYEALEDLLMWVVKDGALPADPRKNPLQEYREGQMAAGQAYERQRALDRIAAKWPELLRRIDAQKVAPDDTAAIEAIWDEMQREEDTP
jgi:hypothetical protein